MLTHLIYSNNYDFWFRDIYKFGNIYVFVTDTVSYCVFVGQQHWILYHMHISLKKLKNVETIFKVIHIRGRQKIVEKWNLMHHRRWKRFLQIIRHWRPVKDEIWVFLKKELQERKKERKERISLTTTKPNKCCTFKKCLLVLSGSKIITFFVFIFCILLNYWEEFSLLIRLSLRLVMLLNFSKWCDHKIYVYRKIFL